MIRGVNKIISVTSFVLCILTLGLFVRSFWVCDTLSRNRLPSKPAFGLTVTHALFCDNGQIGFELTRETYGIPFEVGHVVWELTHVPAWLSHPERRSLLERLGFQGHRRQSFGIAQTLADNEQRMYRGLILTRRYTRDTWTIPGLLPVAVFGIYPAINGFRRLRRRGKSGLCRNCNYDLTGNTSGVCPECGTPLKLPEARPWR
jgi:hypothetical protein